MPPVRSDPFDAGDFNAIEATISETARGRWFLAEFAKRSRSEETLRVLEAIKLLEASLAKRSDARSAHPDRRSHRVNAERIGERLLDFAWHLRESGFDAVLCDALDRDAQTIVSILIGTEQTKEGESAPASALPNGAQSRRSTNHDQTARASPPVTTEAVDTKAVETKAVVTAAAALPAAAAPASAIPAHKAAGEGPEGRDPRLAALERLDLLPLTEKLSIFS
jgi:hypothetical protein